MDESHPLIVKYVRNHVWPLFDNELRRMKRSNESLGKFTKRMQIIKPRANFLLRFWTILSCLPNEN